MTLQMGGVIGAVGTLLAAITALVVAFRKSGSESDDSWQRRVREQLDYQVTRNNELLKRVESLESALMAEREERHRSERLLRDRIVQLETLLRVNGISVPSSGG